MYLSIQDPCNWFKEICCHNFKFSFSNVLNPGNKLIGYFTEFRSFGDVLPNETIHILIGSTFPRMEGFTKIES